MATKPVISPKHLLPVEERKALKARNSSRFKKVESILADAYADLANGMTRTEVISKLMGGLYEAQDRGITQQSANAYVQTIEQRLAQDFENQRGELSNKIALGYITVYQDALKNGDRMNANKALDGLAKLIGGTAPQTAIQINGSKEGGINVTFGFGKPNDTDDGTEL